MSWSTNWDSSKGVGKLPLTTLEELRQALLERRKAIGASSSGIMDTPLEKFDRLPSNWFSTFQFYISNLIIDTRFDYFVDHTQYSGDFNGAPEIPRWTETTLLTSIGDSTRIPAPSSQIVCAKWAYQNFNILNLLRWRIQPSIPQTERARRESTESSAVRWATTAQAWSGPSSEWDSASYVTNSSKSILVWTEMARYSGGTPYTAFLQNYRGKYTYTFAIDSYASIDVYSKSVKESRSFGGLTPSYTFATETGWTEDTYVNHETISEQDLTSTIVTSSLITIGKGNQPADPISDNTVQVRTALLTDASYVLKFDGANGFTYKDW
jgi:hypothetical protein